MFASPVSRRVARPASPGWIGPGSLLAIAAMAIAPAARAQAADDAGGARVALSGGTLGIGPEIGWRSAHVGVRANAVLLGFDHAITPSDIRYDGRIKLRSAGAMVDVFPSGGGFFVSAGARYNGSKARVRATPVNPVEIGGQTYTPAQIGTITGHGDTRAFAPALTLGWAGHRRRGVFVGAEAGALFQGKVRVSRFSTTNAQVSAADLEDERRDVQHDVGKYQVYPIAQIVLGYRF